MMGGSSGMFIVHRERMRTFNDGPEYDPFLPWREARMNPAGVSWSARCAFCLETFTGTSDEFRRGHVCADPDHVVDESYVQRLNAMTLQQDAPRPPALLVWVVAVMTALMAAGAIQAIFP